MKTKKELESLLQSLSLEEKVAQMLQLTGDYFSGSGISTGPESRLDLPEAMIRGAGSILNVTGNDTLYQVQKNYLEKSSSKIPLLFMADVINGFKTVFPIPLAQGCSFDPQLVRECAAVSARESAAAGLHVTFSPMADLCRDARWGRVMESTGEDVWLNRQMTRAMVEGYQGDSLDAPGTIASCVKHFAAYGAPEAGREYNSVDMSEKRLREEYLLAYHEAIQAGASMVMTAFNTVNGVPATCSQWLNRDILRGEWNFDGMVISDYSSICELIAHGVAEDEKEAAELAVKAGVDMDMVSPAYGKNLTGLVESGKVLESLVDQCVLHILELKNRLGLLDNPYRFDEAVRKEQEALIGCEAHKALARKMAGESVVLLKNHKALPLADTGQTVALIGPFADSPLLSGSWSLFCDEKDIVTVKQGMEERFHQNTIISARGCCLLEPDQVLSPFRGAPISGKEERGGRSDSSLLKEAIETAKNADTVILTLGEHPQQSGEGASKTDLTLPRRQLELLDRICEANSNVIVLLFGGRPLVIGDVLQKARAVLMAWFPGTEGGHAIADILSGDINPSARLSMCFPWCTGQAPVYYSHLRTGRPFQVGKKSIRFTSNYQDAPREPLFPFGYGLSFTEFTYRGIALDADEFSPGGAITVRGFVKNTGDRAGTETVLCYVQDVTGSTARPVKELKGFTRLQLDPGEEKAFAISVPETELRFFRADKSFGTEPGIYRIYIHDCVLECSRT